MEQLTIRKLAKTYANGVRALDDISLDISRGMFGLLGPNGAGKSTLMRTLATLQTADAGEVRFNDIDVLRQPRQLRRQLGYLPQSFGLYPTISAQDLLDHLAVLKGITNRVVRRARVSEVLLKTNLYEVRHQRLGGFSGGMKQRFGIAQALLAEPRLLIVDEPTAGLDPTERNRFHALLSELAESTIVIYSTHIVDDVRELCTRMAIIDGGRVKMQGDPRSAISSLGGKIYRRTIPRSELAMYRLRHRLLSSKLLRGETMVDVFSERSPGPDFTPITPVLEHVYFSHVQPS